MSKSTNRKSVKSAGKGKAAPKPPSVESVVERIGQVVSTFGTPDALTKAATDALQTATRSEEGHRAWVAVAVLSVESGQSGREFERVALDKANGNGITRTRLVRVATLLDSARKARKTVPYWSAVAVANSGGKAFTDTMAAYADKRDPFAGSVDADGKAKRGEGKRAASTSTRARKVTVTPDQYPAVLALILANVDKIATDTARKAVREAAAAIAAHDALQPKGQKGKAPKAA